MKLRQVTTEVRELEMQLKGMISRRHEEGGIVFDYVHEALYHLIQASKILREAEHKREQWNTRVSPKDD